MALSLTKLVSVLRLGICICDDKSSLDPIWVGYPFGGHRYILYLVSDTQTVAICLSVFPKGVGNYPKTLTTSHLFKQRYSEILLNHHIEHRGNYWKDLGSLAFHRPIPPLLILVSKLRSHEYQPMNICHWLSTELASLARLSWRPLWLALSGVVNMIKRIFHLFLSMILGLSLATVCVAQRDKKGDKPPEKPKEKIVEKPKPAPTPERKKPWGYTLNLVPLSYLATHINTPLPSPCIFPKKI